MSLEPEQSLTLRKAIEVLRGRGQSSRADNYMVYVEEVAIIHNMTVEKVLDKTPDEVADLLTRRPIPPEYRDWDTFAWGKDYVRRSS